MNNRLKINWSFVYTVTFAVLISCFVIVGITRLYNDYVQTELEKITNRLGVRPSGYGLNDYINANITVGMDRKDAEKRLVSIGPLRIEKTDGQDSFDAPAECYRVLIALNSLAINNLDLMTCYDKFDNLIVLYSLNYDAFPISVN